MYVFITSKQRSRLMRKIRSSDTGPERTLRRRLWGEGIRVSRKTSSLPGKPDIVLEKYKIAIFVDGEFWHGYQWKKKRKKIKANREYWIPKIERNIARDKYTNKILRGNGWIVIRFWEHQIKKGLNKCVQKIKSKLERNQK